MTRFDPSVGSVELELTLEEMAFGCERAVSFDVAGPCINCGGSGRDEGETCGFCDGGGTMRFERESTVELPPGLSDGEAVELECEGIEGGIVAVVREQPNSVFKRDGLDLQTTVNVEEWMLERGGAVDVGTLDDEVLVKIEAGLEDGAVVRIEGQGMPSREDPDRRGALVVTVRAEPDATPEQLEVRSTGRRNVLGWTALLLIGIAIVLGAVLWRADQVVCEPTETTTCISEGREVTADEQRTELNVFAFGLMVPGAVVAVVGARGVVKSYRAMRDAEPSWQVPSELPTAQGPLLGTGLVIAARDDVR